MDFHYNVSAYDQKVLQLRIAEQPQTSGVIWKIFDTLVVFLRKNFRKKNQKKSADDKKFERIPCGKGVIAYFSVDVSNISV